MRGSDFDMVREQCNAGAGIGERGLIASRLAPNCEQFFGRHAAELRGRDAV